MTAVDAKRVEEAGLNSLQTQRQLFYDGWLLRLSPGSAKRGRSVNAHFGSSLSVASKIEHCERVYERHRLPVLFRITPFIAPFELDAALAERGYVAFDETLVETLVLERPIEVPACADGVGLEATDADSFVDAVAALRGSTRDQRKGHRERLAQTVLDTRFALVRAGTRIACTAQVAIDDELVGVFDVVTAPDLRGNGYATLACASLLSWACRRGAKVAYLQVNADNAAAIAVYRKFGFVTTYRYHYRGLPGACE